MFRKRPTPGTQGTLGHNDRLWDRHVTPPFLQQSLGSDSLPLSRPRQVMAGSCCSHLATRKGKSPENGTSRGGQAKYGSDWWELISGSSHIWTWYEETISLLGFMSLANQSNLTDIDSPVSGTRLAPATHRTNPYTCPASTLHSNPKKAPSVPLVSSDGFGVQCPPGAGHWLSRVGTSWGPETLKKAWGLEGN